MRISKILLRIAAIIMLLQGVGHTMGVATWQNPDGDVPEQVMKVMQDIMFNFNGKQGATMAGFYSGFGYCGTIFLVFITVLLWILSGWTDKSVIKILWITNVAIIALAVDEIIYFPPLAVTFCLSSVALVSTSIVFIKKCKSVK